ncbi:MAG: hypothetical protein M3Q69_15030 [Acidobacteriota bacterium]|nr:hypothetical protein [Acidobacteriota bacterium]
MRELRLLLSTLVLLLASAPAFAQSLPQDAQPTCVASPQLFASWFQSGSVTANGVVNPANSLTLDTSTNCNFYLWSQQMHLWLLSPAPASYGGSGRVFDSNVFYDVSEPNAQKKRYFIPHTPFTVDTPLATRARRMVNLRPAKPGPNGLPAVMDRSGNIIEVVPAQLGANRRPLVLNQSGKQVEAARVTVTADKRAVFHDAAGKPIAQPKLSLPRSLQGARIGQRFFTEDNTPIIVGPDGTIFDVSPAQAGGAGVLLAQNTSVVYYTILANDVYTYFASGVNSGKITAADFPTTQSDLNTIQSYAGQTFTDGIALAVEVKLSWVDISAVQNPSSYVTTPAFVPTYDMTNPQKWVPTGEKLTTLALVGVHFVGSAKGHPEMIWSTFEHFGNSPNGQYQYVNLSGQTITVPASSAGNWLFSATNSSGPFNVAHANYQNPPFIEGSPIPKSTKDYNVSASDTQRVYAFGVAPSGQPNQNDPTPAAANTEVVSINNSILGMLPSNDVRSNYYFVGSTWTFGGYSPTGQYNPITNSGKGSEIGTNRLANSTMETYHQASTSINPPPGSGLNCFSCHTDGGTGQLATTEVSHIFSDMLPLGVFPMFSPTDAPPPRVIPTAKKMTSGNGNATQSGGKKKTKK